MDIENLIESLSPIERKVTPFLGDSIDEIIEKSGMDRVSVLRALEFLNSKKIISLNIGKKKIVDLGTNGIYYKKKGLPERRLLEAVGGKIYSIKDANKKSRLSRNEFKAALGALKKMAFVEIRNGKIYFSRNGEEIVKKTIEEKLLEELPIELAKLSDEQKFAFHKLKNRKEILMVVEEQVVSFDVSDIGKKLMKMDLNKTRSLLEELTPQMIKTGIWKGKKFRKYDVVSRVPKIYGGKKHFVSQVRDYGRRIWSEMGFEEMGGDLLQSSFWNFDALFTSQDHPARELQDTFFINETMDLPSKEIVREVKKAHEKGVYGSKGWRYSWDENEARKMVLRTHTTCLSVRNLAMLRKFKNKKGKFFAIGKCFRNETIDANHLFEFNQTEGIVIDEGVNFSHLLGYLETFLNKMGFSKVRFRPHFFPYTEPSVEADVWDEKNNKWVEVLGAGILRPEVTVPLVGEWIPVLAWGMGFDRLVMRNYDIKDIRNLYNNDLRKLRNVKIWKK